MYPYGTVNNNNPNSMELFGNKRKREETPSEISGVGQKKIKETLRVYQYETPPEQEVFSVLANETKDLLFRTFCQREGFKNLLLLRLVDTTFKALIDDIVSRTYIKSLPPHDPSEKFLTQFSSEWPTFYENSQSKNFLKCLLVHRDYSTPFEAAEDDFNPVESQIKKLIETNYYSYCRQFNVTLEVIDGYRKHVESQGMQFQPTVVECNEGEIDEWENDYLQMLTPLLTKELRTLRVTIPHVNFSRITEPEERTTQPEESEKTGRLGKFLGGQTLPNLSELMISNYDGSLLEWIPESSLTAEDVSDLAKLTPNLRELRFKECCVGGSLLTALLTSELTAQLKILEFKNCPFVDYKELGVFLRNAQMPNLECLYLPDFMDDGENEEDLADLDNAISQLGFNSSLTKLKTIIVSNETLEGSTVGQLLLAITHNKHLVSLEKVKGLAVEADERLPAWSKSFYKAQFSKKFKFDSISGIFREN